MQHDDYIEAGDPRYDGFRITELWVATGVDPQDDQEGVLYSPLTQAPLMASDQRAYTSRLKPAFDKIVEMGMTTSFKDVGIKHFRLVEQE